MARLPCLVLHGGVRRASYKVRSSRIDVPWVQDIRLPHE